MSKDKKFSNDNIIIVRKKLKPYSLLSSEAFKLLETRKSRKNYRRKFVDRCNAAFKQITERKLSYNTIKNYCLYPEKQIPLRHIDVYAPVLNEMLAHTIQEMYIREDMQRELTRLKRIEKIIREYHERAN